MAGQQQQSFRPDNLQTPDFTAAPSVNVTPARPVAAQENVSGQVSAMQSLSNAFGGFFQNLQGDAERVNAVTEQARIVGIQRENQDLAKQGTADQAAGRTPDTVADQRESYHDAYEQSFATNQAFQMQQAAAQRLRDMPKDGSVNPADVVKGVWKDFYGSGTGDKDFDASLVSKFTPAAQALVAQTSEQVAQTQERNQSQEIQDSAYSQINSPQGLSEAGFASLDTRVLSMARGDRVLADKMVGQFMGSVRNKSQALGLLNVLDSSGWADRNPVEYAKMSQDAVRQIQTVKSVEAAQQVDNVRMAAIQLRMNPNATVADWANLAYQAQRVDSNHGVGLDKFGLVFSGMEQASKQKAVINYMGLAEHGYQGTHDINTIASVVGKEAPELIKQSYDPWMVQKIQQDGGQQFPALFASMSGNAGRPDPLASDQAGSEFVNWVTAPGVRDLSGGTMPPRIQADMAQALKSGDPTRAARAWTALDRIHDQVGDTAFGSYLGKDDEASSLYWGMKAIAPTNGDVTANFKAIRDGGMDAKLLEKIGAGASINWEPLLPGKKQADVDQAVNTAMGKAALQDVGRSGLIWDPNTSMSTDLRRQFQTAVIQQLMTQRANGTVDLNVATQNAAKMFMGTRMATVGMNGTVKIIDDPFNGGGRTAGTPLNTSPDSPFSTTKGYAPIYSSFAMQNAAGEQEDPFKTAQGDLKDLGTALPGLISSPSGLSLKRPDRTGLSEIHDSMDNPIILRAGQKLTVRRLTDGQTDPDYAVDPQNPDQAFNHLGEQAGQEVAGEVPKDPAQATAFFKDRLPPGVFAVYDQQHNQYTLNYGFRLNVTQAKAAQMRSERAAGFASRQARRQDFMQGAIDGLSTTP